MAYDLRWDTPNYFDQPFDESKLRNIQHLAGVDPIDRLKEDIVKYGITKFHELLRGLITLLPGATGTGKTVLKASVLFKINKVFGVGSKRVRNVVLFTTDRTLRDMIAEELASELIKFGMIKDKLTVRTVESFVQLAKWPGDWAITVICIQSVWETKDARHSEREIKDALSLYDTAVFDECDWANKRVHRTSDLMPHALQFALTASPPAARFSKEEMEEIRKSISTQNDESDDDEEPTANAKEVRRFIQRFVVIAEDAVADYERAVELDSCLKLIDDDVRVRGNHEEHIESLGGDDLTVNEKAAPDAQLWASAVADAIREQDDLETAMREIDPKFYYSPHLIVRLPNINYVRIVQRLVTVKILELKATKDLKNNGWGASAIYSGTRTNKNIDPEERDLMARSRDGKFRHPFMRARDLDGRADESCKRVLLICDIGVRGLNHHYVNGVVDCTNTTSVIELIQFDYGRPIRWPTNRKAWHNDETMNRFVKLYVYVPDGGEKFVKTKKAALKDAREFILDMRDRIGGAFFTWSDLMEAGEKPDTFAPEFVPLAPPLRMGDKYKIQEELNDEFEKTGGIDESSVEKALEFLDEDVKAKGRRYANKLIDDLDFRNEEVFSERAWKDVDEGRAAIAVLKCIKPQKSFDPKDLIRFVKEDVEYKDDWRDWVDGIEKVDKFAIKGVSGRLREIQRKNYSPTDKCFKLSKEVIDPVTGELMGRLRKANELRPGDDFQTIVKLIRGAAKDLFGLEDSTDDGVMGTNTAYAVAILGTYREDVIGLARRYHLKGSGKFSQINNWRRRT